MPLFECSVLKCLGVVSAATAKNLHLIQHESKALEKGSVFVNGSYHMKGFTDEVFTQFIEDFLARGIIEPSNSPWSHPVFLIPKKDKKTWRFICDYTELNKVTIRDRFPLLQIAQALQAVGGREFYSGFDLPDGFYGMELDDESKELTAFSAPTGSYQFKKYQMRRLGMGLANAPAAFQRAMLRVFGDLQERECVREWIVPHEGVHG